MLLEFTVGNYLSFGGDTTLTLVASEIPDVPQYEGNATELAEHTVLNSAVIFGPNASGKSNLIRAMLTMRRLVLVPRSGPNERVRVTPFRLHSELTNEPSYFEVVISLTGTQYRYGFEVTRKGDVISEWLYRMDGEKAVCLFTHAADELTNGLRINTRTCDVEEAILRWFKSITQSGYLYGRVGPQVSKFISRMDLGITEVKVLGGAVVVVRPVVDEDHEPAGFADFCLTEESSGVRWICENASAILDSLKNGTVLLVDDFGSGLHPELTAALLKLYHDPHSNPHGAQLIATTQVTYLLDNSLLRRDQIWLMEKDKQHQSGLTSLVLYKVPDNINYSRMYMQGRVGGVPFPRGLVSVVMG